MVGDRFNAIKETDFASLKRFEKSEEEKRKKSDLKSVTSGKKHELDVVPFPKNQPKKKTRTGEKEVSEVKPKLTNTRSKAVGSRKKDTEAPELSQTRPMLCVFDLKHQLLKKEHLKCKLGDKCDRDHYRKSLRESEDYYWNEKTMSDQVKGARDFIISESDKNKLLEEVRKTFA